MQTQFGKYTLLQKLGDGGMAEVFLAQIQGLQGFSKFVALKRMLPHLSNDRLFTQSFINEARLGGYLNHHNIVQTLEFGQEEGRYFLALEFVRGVTLETVIEAQRRRNQPLAVPLALEIAAQIADGLAYAHAAESPDGSPLRMVHRDLKPSNILINHHGVCKISDFGIARSEASAQQTIMAGGEVKGTVAYMSPEQAMGLRDLDYRSDLYSLGALLYEMLTNLPLYPQESYLATLRMVQDGTIAERLERLHDLPQGKKLYALLSRILAYKREERFSSAFELARALREVQVDFDPDWDLSRYLKTLLPNSPLNARGTVLSVNVAESSLGTRQEQSNPGFAASGRLQAGPPGGAPPALVGGPGDPGGAGLQEVAVDPRFPPPPAPPARVKDTGRSPIPDRPDLVQEPLEPGREISQTMPPRSSPQPAWRSPALWIGTGVGLLIVVALAFVLRPLSSTSITLNSTPQGATLLGPDGQSLGQTPLLLPVPSAGLSVTLKLEGHTPQTITLTADAPAQHVALSPLPATLRLQVSPAQARVLLDGQPIAGTSPFALEAVPPGSHALQVAADGFRSEEQPLTLAPGEEKSLAVTLKPETPGSKPREPGSDIVLKPPRPSPPTDQGPRRVDSAPARSENMGFLTLNAYPYAKVEIDGVPIKSTPLIKHPVAAGTHKVRLTADDGRARSFDVTIVAGEQTKRVERFDEAP